MKKEVNNFPYHSITIKETLKKLSSKKEGLTSKEAEIRLEKYGKNELPEKGKSHPIIVFLKQFNSFFVYLLIVAAIISYLVDSHIDMYVILAVILINSSIGFFQEYRAENSIAALNKMIVQNAKVFRNSELLKVPASNLVPGDIISLESGDRIPADARIIEAKNLSTVESSLTGESLPVNKNLTILRKETVLADRKNMVLMGTFVSTGTAKAIVVSTSTNTVIGSIVKDIEKIKRQKSHFQKKTDKLAIQMGIIALIGALLTFIVGFFIRGFDFVEILLFTIASLVSGIPEGLPAVLAVVLAVGAFRMAKRKALIRNLPATETLSVVNTIITDKTGTLTQNTMNVQKVYLPGEKEIIVTGEGWFPKGDFKQKNKPMVPLENPQLSKLLHISAICNNASLIKEEQKDKEETYKIIGDPTEASLVALAQKAGLKKSNLSEEKIIEDLPFNQLLKYRASLVSLIKEKRKQIYVIGAPEVVIEKSTHLLRLNTSKVLTSSDKSRISNQINSLTNGAMRVLAIAYRDISKDAEILSEKNCDNLTFVGLVGIRDPPRPEVKDAIEKAQKSGIRVIMATGDHKITALAVAKEIGLTTGKSKKYQEVLTEEELKKLDSKEFEKAINNVNIFARLTPHTKLRIAETLQKSGNIIAMTGDGVNDAPALKKADIGISMGLIGTDVARESSEIILADDNFASIISAIEEGRIVFNNTKQTSFFLITTNFAEDLTIITTLLLGLPLPLLPTQILWLNLITDTGPGIGLATEPGHNGLAEEKPRNSEEGIITKDIIPFMIIMAVTMMAIAVSTFMILLSQGIEKARTGAFVAMAMTQLFNSFNMRSLKKSIFKVGLFSNKLLTGFLVISLMVLCCMTPNLQHSSH